jgi:hypothetical protein
VVLSLPGGAWAQSESAEAEDTPPEVEEGETAEALDPWRFDLFGYVRAGLDFTETDPNYDFVGANSGFVLQNARLGLAGDSDVGIRFALSVDGAADFQESPNTPLGSLDVRLRDALIAYHAPGFPWLELTIGQFKVPFSQEELFDEQRLLFASRAVGVEGVRVGRGLEEPGIVVGRQLGMMLSSVERITIDDFGIAYFLTATNGNGINQLLNDNTGFAFTGRLTLHWADLVQLGGSVLWNERTIGEPPNLFDESDLGFSGDLLVTVEGLEVFGQLTTLTTEFPTVGTPDREQLAYHAQIGYRIDGGIPANVTVTPAYRFAYFHPRAEGGVAAGGVDLDAFQLTYHTVGLRFDHTGVPWSLYGNFTFTLEEPPYELTNHRVEVIYSISF